MKTALIINPKSASGNTMKMWSKVKTPLQRLIGSFEIVFTEHPHHAEKLVREFSEKGIERLIVMGGDGTINEVVNGLVDTNGKNINPNIKLGILNSGRGCDFIRSLNIPTDPLKAISKFVDMRTKLVDIGQVKIDDDGKIKTYYFVNSCGFGLGGEVAKNVSRADSFLPPELMYLTSSLMGVFKSKPFDVEVIINDEKTLNKEVVNIFIMNGRYSGGGMDWAPQARLDDGLLDFIILENVSKLKIAMMTPKVYTGTFLKQKEVYYEKVRKLVLKTTRRMWLETDGEINRSSQVEIACIPKVVPIIY